MKITLLILGCFFQAIVFSQPVITSFAPASGPVGTSVIITGTGFSSTPVNNIVYFGAVRGAVTAATATSLSVTVPAGATYKFISVMAGGLTGFSRKPFTVTFAGGGNITANSFASRKDLAANSSGTISITVKDLDNDGKPDITGGNVSVYKNNSTPGNFAISAPLNLTANSLYYYTAVEDLDGDGKPDIMAPYTGTPAEVKIFRNLSSGGTLAFSPFISIATTGGRSIAAADFDGDGKIDFATNYGGPGSASLAVHRNTSTVGNISFAPKVEAGADPTTLAMTVGYLNNDNKPDLVLTSTSPANTFRVYLNTSSPGNISFAAQNQIPSATGIYGVSVADFDGDDKADIVIATTNAATMGVVSVYKNTSTGTGYSLAPKVDYTTGLNWIPEAIAIGDINGDGKPDMAVCHGLNKAISVFQNSSTGGTISFLPKVDFLTLEPIQFAIDITDFDVDGKPEICAGNYSPNNVISFFKDSVAVPVVPVALASFTVTRRGNDADLTWTAQYGQNVRNFIVERSVDGVYFTTIATIAAVGNSNAIQQYQYTDVNAVSLETENIYYRLRPVNLNGTFTYSNLLTLNTGNISFGIVNITPSIFTDKFTLNINAGKTENVSLIVFDATGNIVLRKETVLQRGNNQVAINGANLNAGIYLIKLIRSNGRTTIARVVKL